MSDITTIDDVLSALDRIIDTTIDDNSPLGIFALVYRRTTAHIAEGISSGRFEDRARMVRFDIAFAQRYIDAFWDYRDRQPVTHAWEVAFAASGDAVPQRPVVVQHLLLGMNAHINLDLGITAARIAPGVRIDSLENDFMTINLLLAELIDQMQQRISRVSPLMFLLDWIGKRDDEAIVNFSIERARDFAWSFACNLARAEEQERKELIRETDHHISDLGRLVAYPPGFLLPRVLAFIRVFEEKDTADLIRTLRA